MGTETDPTNRMPPPAPGEGPDRRWRVLFISDHGKVFTFKRVKTLIGLTVVAFLLSLAAVAVLAAVNQRIHGRYHDLERRFKAIEQKAAQLQNERDLLTAQVVLVETRMKEVLGAGPRPTADAKRPADGQEEKATEKGPAAAAQTVPGKALETAVSEPAPAFDDGIALEDLRVGHQRRGNTISIRVRVRNTNSSRRPLAGHLVAVLKGAGLPDSQWLALPSVRLADGRPSGKQKGYSFSINHSITLEHSVPVAKSLPVYDTAVLYVFSKEGDLLFVQEFAIDIQPSDE